jgi:flagellar protein FlgJ
MTTMMHNQQVQLLGVPIQPSVDSSKIIRDHKKAAQQFEALLLHMMIQSMRQASYKDEEDSNALDTFRGMYDQNLSEMMANQGGIGLADSLIRDMSKFNPALNLEHETKIDRSSGDKDIGLSSRVQKAIQIYQDFQPGLNGKKTQQLSKDADQKIDRISERKTLSITQQNFVDTLSVHAQKAAEKIGVAPELIVAHAALESGWGKRSIKYSNGAESHNLFGIKASAQWQGKVVDVMTTEYIHGVAQKRVEKFRAYDSYSQAFDDYARLLTSNPRYQKALNQGDNGSEFAKALQKGGYATDPQYAQKLASVVQKVDAL